MGSLSLDDLAAIGRGLEPGETADVLIGELRPEAQAELLERNPALAAEGYEDTVIHVSGDESDSHEARGGSLCDKSRWWIAHQPGCSSAVKYTRYKERCYDNCPHPGFKSRGYQLVIDGRCKNPSCPHTSHTTYIYHRPL
jgi:hypothetical protein